MKTMRHVAALLVAALLFALCGTAGAQAGHPPSWGTGPRIDGFDVEQVDELAEGGTLLFTLFGTPGADASLQIEGGAHALALAEHEPGVYEGRYVIAPGDRVRGDSRVVGQLRRRGEVVRAELEEPLVLGTPFRAAGSPGESAPRASPDGPAPIATAADRAPVARVAETAPAEVAADPAPIATRGEPVPALRLPQAIPAAARDEPVVPSRCPHCGVVESIARTEVPAAPGLLGLIAGGLIGAILGDQVAHGDDRPAARIVGAVGGAYAGREIERHAGLRHRYDVVVRLPDGQRRTVAYDRPPQLRVGERVQLARGRLLRLP